MPDLKVLKFQNNTVTGRPDIEMSLSNGKFVSGPTFYSGVGVAVQDAIRALLTKFGTNYLCQNFGTNIQDIIMSRTAGQNTGVIGSQAQYTLGYLSLYRSNDDASESIVQINSLTAKKEVDTLRLKLTLTTGAGEQAIVEVK
jgi:hypothetical protein